MIKYKKNQSFFQEVLPLFYSQRGCLGFIEAPPLSNLFNSKYIYSQRDKLTHSLKMYTGHFHNALPFHKLINAGISVISSKPYFCIFPHFIQEGK
jgi:hypothetical protein